MARVRRSDSTHCEAMYKCALRDFRVAEKLRDIPKVSAVLTGGSLAKHKRENQKFAVAHSVSNMHIFDIEGFGEQPPAKGEKLHD